MFAPAAWRCALVSLTRTSAEGRAYPVFQPGYEYHLKIFPTKSAIALLTISLCLLCLYLFSCCICMYAQLYVMCVYVLLCNVCIPVFEDRVPVTRHVIELTALTNCQSLTLIPSLISSQVHSINHQHSPSYAIIGFALCIQSVTSSHVSRSHQTSVGCWM